jgi:TetR/AcrR family transcriptional regulator, transcriptional repressor for nem operon
MRITRQAADENKTRVVLAAARLFREHGFDGVGVATVMREAGLTHGGFYNHFGSKDDLEAEACAEIFAQSAAKLEAVGEIEAPDARAEALAGYQRRYLSRKGRDATATQCPMVAFAGDIVGQSEPVRAAYAAGLRRYLKAYERASAGPGKGRTKARQRAIAEFTAMCGALTMARSVAKADPELSEEILEAAFAGLAMTV